MEVLPETLGLPLGGHMKINQKRKYFYKKVFEPVKAKKVSPTEYLEIVQNHTDNIERVEYLAPKIGDDNFGSFKVTYRIPVLCEVNI
ncbi:hypothetical protein [Providencia stuartii]|uniref:hypothetical protein n=1 Tax=Providencia stuartii TaxID=588 RepID=UPI0018C7FBCC|nr:hypothetical protein [Providencia stuartii]MBG5896795.1 hypothetical protein [Providencia stuartii]